MNKRSFFKRLFGGAVGLVSLPVLSRLPTADDGAVEASKPVRSFGWTETFPPKLTINDFGAASTVDVTTCGQTLPFGGPWLESSTGADAWFPAQALEGSCFWFQPSRRQAEHLVGVYIFRKGAVV